MIDKKFTRIELNYLILYIIIIEINLLLNYQKERLFMKKYFIVLIFAIMSSSVYAQDDGEIFARAMELFNAKNYDNAAAEFLKVQPETAYYPSALYMAGACYNMKYSDVATVRGASMTKEEIRQGIADLEKACVYYEKSCEAGYQQGCTQGKIIKQVIITLQNYLK